MNIFNLRIDKYTKAQLMSLISRELGNSNKVKIAKINPEFIHRALKDKKFLEVLNLFDLNIVDGRGILWAARYLTLPFFDNKLIRPVQAIWQMIYSGAAVMLRPKFITYPIPEAIPGVEAFNLMMQVASDKKVEVFLFGGSTYVLSEAIKNIKIKFPNIKISGFLDGYSYQSNFKLNPVDEINKTNAQMLIVALGSPRQEYWINDNIDKLKNIKIAVGEGGTLDRVANPTQKAPRFINRIGLEWLWRLLFNKSKTETRTRFQRFWNSVPLFIYQVVKWKVKNGQTKI